jgi:hypothetical protein
MPLVFVGGCLDQSVRVWALDLIPTARTKAESPNAALVWFTEDSIQHRLSCAMFLSAKCQHSPWSISPGPLPDELLYVGPHQSLANGAYRRMESNDAEADACNFGVLRNEMLGGGKVLKRDAEAACEAIEALWQ